MVPRFASAHRQRGAIGLMAAFTLGMALLFMLLVIDSGRLYLEQRKLQRVVDAAALEASNLNAVCSGTGVNALTQATASAARNGYTVGTGSTLTATCGTLSTGSNNLRTFTANATATQAIQVAAVHTVATSVASGLWTMVSGGGFSTTTNLHAVATAGYVGNPLAQLNIRSTLASVDSTQSPLLNALLGGLLGASLNLTAAQYNGLLNTDVNLLSYLNQAAITANITAGDYTTLLNANLSVTTLIQAAATLASQNGAGVDVTTALGQISALGNATTMQLGSLIQTTTGSVTSGLNGTLQLFQLVQGIIQVATAGKAVDISTAVNLGSLANVSVKVALIEPPQFSATGNPALAKVNPTGTNRIYVNTAQARILVSFQSSAINSLLNGALSTLNALRILCLTGGCNVPDVRVNTSIDVGILAGNGSAYVTDYNCQGTAHSLTTQTNQSAATVIVGSIDSTNFFSSSSPATNSPLTLLDIGSVYCAGILGTGCGTTHTVGTFGALTLGANSTVAGSSTNYVYTPTSNVGQTSLYHSFSSSNVISSLSNTLSGISINFTSTGGGGLLATILTAVTSTVSLLISNLLPAVTNILGTLIDPLINSLLSLLGIDLATVDVGANLTCQTGRAQLVL